ncbi:MAG: hypothetical protein ABI054_06060 [Planctomycetota bacterium]
MSASTVQLDQQAILAALDQDGDRTFLRFDAITTGPTAAGIVLILLWKGEPVFQVEPPPIARGQLFTLSDVEGRIEVTQ